MTTKDKVRSTEEALKLALEALENLQGLCTDAEDGWVEAVTIWTPEAITAIREALAESQSDVEQPEQQEPVREMPSNTRYTVAVEGHTLTYWDNVHDAITNAQRAVYAGPDATCRAIDDLKAGRLAEWSYGLSAVRIYPPQNTSPPISKSRSDVKPWVGLTDEEKSDLWCESTGRDCVNEDTHVFADAIEAKLKEKNDF